MAIGISYEYDIDQAREAIRAVLVQESLMFETPETVIAVSELADSSVNLIVPPWVKTILLERLSLTIRARQKAF
ncbi:MAG: small conductance mechanosensitive channel [Arenicella sp.]|jgi:small conductance mechanosensitive channel